MKKLGLSLILVCFASTAFGNVDFSLYQTLLDHHLKTCRSGERAFDYRAASQNDDALFDIQDQGDLIKNADLSQLRTTEERLAFWLNAYNFSILRLMIENYEDDLKSIRRIPGWKARINPNLVFTTKYYEFAGAKRSFQEVENDFVRQIALSAYHPSTNEKYAARVHFGLNCASISCPPLPVKIFEAETLNQQLDDATRYALTLTPYLETRSDGVYANKIFSFYEGDFKQDSDTVRNWLLAWAPDSKKPAIQAARRIRYQSYNWDSNKVTPACLGN